MQKHKCVRDCYYNERYWSVGEVIEETPGFEDMPPNKHFLPLGAKVPVNDRPIIVAGDDPRSTKQIRADLEKVFGIKKPKNLPRKKLFAAWREAEQEAGQAPRPMPKKKAPAEAPESVIPSELKPVSAMSPDEIDAITKSEIASRLGVNPISHNKTELIEKALEAGV